MNPESPSPESLTSARQMILVLGMHRSGTSAVAGALAHLGVDFSERLIAASPDNSKGYFEHVDIWQQDHDLLVTLGSTWDDTLPLPDGWRQSEIADQVHTRVQAILRRDFGSAGLAGIKDPRMCRVAVLWLSWLSDEGFSPCAVLVVRKPAEVIASLAQRDQLSAAHAAWVWLRHVLESERATRRLPRVMLRYERLLQDWRAEIARLDLALGLDLSGAGATEALAVDTFLEPTLRHYQGEGEFPAMDDRLRGWVQDAYAAITADDGIDLAALDRIAAEVSELDQLAAAGATLLRSARQHKAQLEEDLSQCDGERLQLVAGNQDLRKNLDRHAGELAQMRMGNAGLQENLDRHVDELTQARVGSAQLQQNLDRHVDELAQVRAGSADLQENLDRHIGELERSRQGNEYLRSEISDWSEQVAGVKSELATVTTELATTTTELTTVTAELATVAAVREETANQLALVYASRSWRLTRPLRGVVRVAGRLRGQSTALPSPAVSAPAVALPADQSVVEPAFESGVEPVVEPVVERAQDPADVLQAAVAAASGARVLIVTPDIMGPIRNGGIGTAFAALARTLAEAGRAVTILYTLGGHSEDGGDIAHWERHYALLGIRFIPVWLERGEPVLDAPHHAWRAYRVYLWLKERQGDYDLAYFPEWKGESYYALQSKRLGLDFERLRIIVVTHSSTTWAESGNYVVPQQFDDLLLEFLERRSTEMADAVISPSQYMVDWMRGRGWAWSAPTYVIQNLMSDALPDTAAAAPAFAVTEWVFFGRLERRKGLLVFLGALRRMPAEVRERIQITFLGKSVGTKHFDSNAEIHQQLADWGSPVKIIDNYDREQALAYLREPGRVAVIASLVENSPYTVLECVLQRIPFVAADVGGIAELIHADDRARALFKPTPAGLAERLSALQGGSYTPPRPASAAASTRQQWLDLQQQLLTDIPGQFPPPRAAEPHISVCLVHYNRPGMLATAIDSLRRQTYPRFDVVLVDDGSPSAEAQNYLDSLEDEFAWRGWSIVRQDNAYLGAARNNAARHAKGDYVMFMDDDNLAKPDELATFAHAAAASDADILTTVSDVFSDTESGPQPPQTSHQLWIPLGNAAGLGVFRNVFGDANALFRRSTFEQLGGFTEDYGIGHEDWELFARASIAEVDLQLVPEPLFWYRVNATSMLRAGHADSDHARSVRPYWEGFGHGVGPALAYASYLQRSPQTIVYETASPTPAESMTTPQGRGQRRWIALSGAFRPEVRARLVQVVRESGWRGAAGRVRRYLGRRS